MPTARPSPSPSPQQGRGPAVSILLPCRNEADHLPEAIASLEAQTFGDFEVIAVDDGSTDATPSLLRRWAERDPRVRTIRTDGCGIVEALRRAASSARGDLVARMDGDDVAEPRRLEAQLDLLDARPDIAACGTRVRYFPERSVRRGARRYESWLNGLTGAEQLARDIFVECPIAHPTLVVRREPFRAAGGYVDRGWPEDYDLVLRLWSAGCGLANVPEVLHRWREAPDRLSRTDDRYSRAAFRRCKVHYLRQTLLRGRPGAIVWGAGSVGKRFARTLREQDVPLHAFVDVNPRKVGQRIYGAPVLQPDDLRGEPDALVLVAVGAPGAREEIRASLLRRDWPEMDAFCVVA